MRRNVYLVQLRNNNMSSVTGIFVANMATIYNELFIDLFFHRSAKAPDQQQQSSSRGKKKKGKK